MNNLRELQELASIAIMQDIEKPKIINSIDNNLALLLMPMTKLKKLLKICQEL